MHCAFVYPGQGARGVTMADAVLEAFPEMATKVFDQAQHAIGIDLRTVNDDGIPPELPWGGKHARAVNPVAQDMHAVVYAVSVITHLGLLDSGWHPNVVAGHQLGTYAALAVSGALSFTDGLLLVREHAGLLPLSYSWGDSPESPPLPEVPEQDRAGLLRDLEAVEFRHPYFAVMGSGTARPIRTAAQARHDVEALIKGQDLWRDTMSLLVGRGRDVVVEVGPGRRLTSWFAQAHPQVVTRSTADVRRIRRLIDHHENGTGIIRE